MINTQLTNTSADVAEREIQEMTSAAERMRKLRERRGAGIRVLPIEVQIETVETLIELNYLSVEDAHDLGLVATALANFINHAVESVTSHSIILDTF